MDYDEFLSEKLIPDEGSGFEVDRNDLNPLLFEFQKDSVIFSLRKGRSLLGLNCGLGKGPIQLEWLKQVNLHTRKPVIMFAPPGVKMQFKSEAKKFGYEINIANENQDIVNGINITNYERLMLRIRIEHKERDFYFKRFAHCVPVEVKRTKDYIQVERYRFDPRQFGGIALDEASILKHHNAKTRERLTEFSKGVPFRIGATATPAPNAFQELISYIEFLGIMNPYQARAKYFIQDGNTSNVFRIKRPAWKKFWEFVSEWAIIARQPSDFGYSDEGYILPDIETRHHIIKDDYVPEGMLFSMPAKGLADVSKIKANSVEQRCQKAAEIALADDDHKLIFVRRNNEGKLLQKLIPGSVEVAGRHSDEEKEEMLLGFAKGKYKYLITKPEIGGFGLNFQKHCHRVISVNVNFSSEEMYQYVRRIYRFGQIHKVIHDLITMDTEDNILSILERKNKQSDTIYNEITKYMDLKSSVVNKVKRSVMDYKTDTHKEEYWTLMLGDSVERVKELEDKSIGCVVTSIPFPAMYAYTDSERDIGNYVNNDEDQLADHLAYVFKNLLPKMMPGRSVHIHLAQGVTTKVNDGAIGGWDFRGQIIRMMQECGYIWDHSWTVEKDPQTERARNNTLGLSQKTLFNSAGHMRPSVSDYVEKFYAPGDDLEPINALLAKKGIHGNYDAPNGWITLDMWINWASNVWYKYRKGMRWWEGINVARVLGSKSKKGAQGFGVKEGKGKDDEKHLCELQLDVIERCIALHSNPGDLVVDTFSGIGSTGYQSLKMGRRYTGLELKDSYHYTAIKNLQWIESEINATQYDLFSLKNIEVEGNELIKRHKQWIAERGISIYDRATNWEKWAENGLNEFLIAVENLAEEKGVDLEKKENKEAVKELLQKELF